MTWREDHRRVNFAGKDLIGASFRGVPFFVESAETSGGRRTVVHEFPLRDQPFVEDLGRGAESFRIEGYVVGDDYLAQRDALIVALVGSDGVGELVHPYEGVKRAVCNRYSVRTTKADGGMAMFAIEFAEAPAQSIAPTETVDAASQVANSADAAAAAIEIEFVDSYDTDGLPSFAIDSAEEALSRASVALGSALAPVVGDAQELAELTSRIAVLTSTAASIVRSPAEALAGFRGVIAGLVETSLAAPGAVMGAFLKTYAADFGRAVVPITSTRERELANQNALIAALRRTLAIEAARLAPLVPYESIDDATSARDAVAAVLEEQASIAGDGAYPSLVNLRSEVLRSVPGGVEFARVVTVTRSTPIPSLLLAYQLYGSVELEPDIVARNPIRHPGFIAGTVKVLSDG